MSKLRSGPAVVFCSQQTAGLRQPGAQICGAPGTGYGRKSGSAVGIGLVLLGFTLTVKPVNPVSSPLITRFWANDPSGSVSGPKVLCGTGLSGSIPSAY